LRILLIAYEFPPGPSPQSLRWARLTRELVRHGAEVRVLTVQRDGERVRLPVPAGLVIERTPAGAASGLVAHVQRRYLSERTGESLEAAASGTSAGLSLSCAEQALNWKGRLVARINGLAGTFAFPDPFGQWKLAARLRLAQLLEDYRPDVVVSSHEPATTLELGRLARKRGFAWLADLGDPVLSGYTPRRWRWRARRVEAWTCRNASHVTVTTAATLDLLARRHQVDPACFSVLPQGYDPVVAAAESAPELPFAPGMLELVYTGSFYTFRRPQALVDAVLACAGARLTVATRTPPPWLAEVAASRPEKIRLAGFLSHAQALGLQRAADVLVNIANDDQVQVPGKLFEYLGAARPILHIGGGDEVERLLRGRRRGISVAERTDEVLAVLLDLARDKQSGALSGRFDLGMDRFPEYEWTNIGARLFEIVRQIASPAPP
jgi:hypothetical protein